MIEDSGKIVNDCNGPRRAMASFSAANALAKFARRTQAILMRLGRLCALSAASMAVLVGAASGVPVIALGQSNHPWDGAKAELADPETMQNRCAPVVSYHVKVVADELVDEAVRRLETTAAVALTDVDGRHFFGLPPGEGPASIAVVKAAISGLEERRARVFNLHKGSWGRSDDIDLAKLQSEVEQWTTNAPTAFLLRGLTADRTMFSDASVRLCSNTAKASVMTYAAKKTRMPLPEETAIVVLLDAAPGPVRSLWWYNSQVD